MIGRQFEHLGFEGEAFQQLIEPLTGLGADAQDLLGLAPDQAGELGGVLLEMLGRLQAGGAITLSRVRETILDTLDDDKDNNLTEVIGTFNYDYGFMNRGTITGNGLNVGFNSTGLKIAGSADGTHSTTIQGGIFNGGTITAQTAFVIFAGSGSGAMTVPNIIPLVSYDFKGSLVIPPGSLIASYTSAASTTALLYNFEYEEVPALR